MFLRFCNDPLSTRSKPKNHTSSLSQFSLYSVSFVIMTTIITLSQPKIVVSTIRIPSVGFVLPPIYWQQRNPIFRRDNTLHIIDVEIGDSIDIVCPDYAKNPDQVEYHAVYMVTKEEYDTCHIIPNMNPSKTRLILNCSEPTKTQIFTISFRDFSPIPQGLEFKRGNDYYFISTSKGTLEGINNLEGGYCETHAMKVMFKVGPRRKTKIRPKQKPTQESPSLVNQRAHTIMPQPPRYSSFKMSPNGRDTTTTERPRMMLMGRGGDLDSHGAPESEEDPIYYYYNHNDRVPYGQERPKEFGPANGHDPMAPHDTRAYDDRQPAPINRASPYNPHKHSLRPIITAYGRPVQEPPSLNDPMNNIKRSEEEERILESSVKSHRPASDLSHGNNRGGARLAAASSATTTLNFSAASQMKILVFCTSVALSCLQILSHFELR